MKKIVFLGVISIVFLGGFFYFVFQSTQAQANSSQLEKGVASIDDLQAKLGDNLHYSLNRNTGKVSFISNLEGSLPLRNLSSDSELYSVQQVADLFMSEYGALFGLDDPATELSLIQGTTDELGMSHIKYNQRYLGVPVFGGQIIVHLSENMSVASANGKAVPGISVDVEPGISSDQAVSRARQLWKNQFNFDSAEVLKTNLYIFNKGLIENKPDDRNYLVWQIELMQEKPALHEFYYIDAYSGDLVYQITGMQSAVNRRIWDCSYGDGDCYMDEYDWVSGHTYGRSEGEPARGTNPNPYIGGTDTDDLYSLTGNIHSYYESKFSRNGANNQGGIGDGSVLFPTASTSGLTYIDYHYFDENDYLSCPNAFFNSANSIHFCNGYVTTDITGHEYGHAVNYFTILDAYGDPAGLTYANQSGALNENNSDVFGEALEYYIDGSSDWLIGEDLSGGASRSMSDPADLTYDLGDGDTPYPGKFYSDNYYCGDSDSGGVHINSSVPNHAAYLMAAGGTFNGCTINGIGRNKEERIFYRAQNVYYTTSSNFNDSYDALVASCGDLYGSSSRECKNVTKALQAVEMNQAGYCSGEEAVSPRACTASVIQGVSSNKANGSYKAGEVIDIDVNFSKEVTSDGRVTVNLETGDTDRKCKFSISNSTTGSCNYTVQAGDRSRDLTVKSISGAVTDRYGNAVTNFTPGTNLAGNKNIVVDTVGPTGSVSINGGDAQTSSTSVTLTLSATDSISGVSRMRFSNDNENWSDWRDYKVSKSWEIGSTEGEAVVYVRFKDGAGNVTNTSDSINYGVPASVITAAGPGGAPHVRAFDYQGNAESNPAALFAFSQSFRGGVHVAACDVDANGTDDIVTGIGPGEQPWVRVFSNEGALITEFLAYDTNILGGVFVACGDLNGDGKAEVITGVPEGFGPHVRVFDGQTGLAAITAGFFAYEQNVRTGIRVASGDLDGDGTDEIIVGTGNGAGTHVRTFNAAGEIVFTPGFFVYDQTDRSGIKVAAGDIDGDGKAEIITGSGPGRTPEVKAYTRYGDLVASFAPYPANYILGVKVAAGDVDGDGVDEIVTGTEEGGGPQVRAFEYDGTALDDFFAYDTGFRGGVDVAVGDLGN